MMHCLLARVDLHFVGERARRWCNQASCRSVGGLGSLWLTSRLRVFLFAAAASTVATMYLLNVYPPYILQSALLLCVLCSVQFRRAQEMS